MKVAVQNLPLPSKYAKIIEWGKLITITGSAQLIIQVIGFLSAIIVIRLLPTKEYALYTLANTMLGTMILLADGGVSTGVMSQGGKIWMDREKLGLVIATGLDLRKKLAIGSLLVAVPILLYLLLHHGASWLMASLITLSLIPAFFMSLSGTLLEVAPKLKQDIAPLQKIQVGTNVLRLILVGLTIFSFPWAYIAVLASGLPQIWANLQLRKSSYKYARFDQPADPLITKEILSFVKKILPGAIYYCASGQITIWLISIFGSTTAVAQVGALGRLVMVLGLFNVLFSTLISPRFARLANDKRILLGNYIKIQIVLFALMALIITIVWLFPAPILWILGPAYANLKNEMVLNIAGSCVALIAGSSFSLYTHRGWAIKPIILIPLSIAAIAVSASLIDISTLHGILLLNIYVAGFEAIMHVLFSLIMINKIKVKTHGITE
ncbi:polysaccharide biosynthesis protein [Mucilaginibacter dorajii]|uniref:Polysaccharide biosynthesis protein n=1 Tax=Mucilaginibacter dorajii TaxID=692994 RepID=A0ABP7QQ64_9SPHI|nr:polysaccharide biosynthesis protein [Mucilaginibacter dorajii]MCS3733785.1 O-antigen/teichoic acid export membrane protein [Mucilaginibacter dorajii]